MKNSADLGGFYPPWPSASVDITLLDLQNSSYPTQPHSIIANYKYYARLFFKKQNCTRRSGSCNFSCLKNSLVQIYSKLNSKPYDYLYKIAKKKRFSLVRKYNILLEKRVYYEDHNSRSLLVISFQRSNTSTEWIFVS